MAEIFLKLISQHSSDQDREGSCKRGMIVTVKEDGFNWGRSSISFFPSACIIKLPGVATSKLQELLVPQLEDDAGSPTYNEVGDSVVYRFRRWQLLIDNIPTSIKQEIENTGEVTLTDTQIRNYIRRIRNDEQYTGLD